jgi:hypothetical protein
MLKRIKLVGVLILFYSAGYVYHFATISWFLLINYALLRINSEMYHERVFM